MSKTVIGRYGIDNGKPLPQGVWLLTVRDAKYDLLDGDVYLPENVLVKCAWDPASMLPFSLDEAVATGQIELVGSVAQEAK